MAQAVHRTTQCPCSPTPIGTERDRAVIKVLEMFRRKSAQTEPKALSGPTCLPSRRRRPPFLHLLDSTPKPVCARRLGGPTEPTDSHKF